MSFNPPSYPRLLSSVLIALIGFAAPALFGTSSIWTGAGTGDSWATDENWEDDTIPPATGEAIFGTGIASNPASEFVVDVDANRTITDITFRDGVWHRFTGEDLHLADGGTLTFAVFHPSAVNGIVFEEGLVIEGADASSDGSYTFDHRTHSRLLNVQGGISGGTTAGSVILNISGNNSSLIQIEGGLSDGGAEGGLALFIDTGAVGELFLGVTRFDGASTHTGGTTMNRGEIMINDADGLGVGPIVWNNGTIRGNNSILAGSQGTRTFTQEFTWNGHLNLISNNLTLNPTSGEVVVGNEAGMHPIISGNNTTLTVQVPFVDGAHPQQIEIRAGGLRIFEAASPDFSGGFHLVGGELSAGNDLGLGTGILTLDGGGFNSMSPTLANAVEWNGTVNMVNSSPTFNGSISLGNEASLDPGLTANGGTRTFNGVISDGAEAGKTLTITNLGRQIFNAENTFTGGVTTSGQWLQLGHDQALGTGTLTLLGHPDSSRDQILEKNIATINVVNDIVLDGRNDTVYLQNASGWNFQGTLTLGSEDGLTPTLSFTGGNTAVFHGEVSSGDPDAVFTKEGTGTIAFANDNTITGDIVVADGTLQIGNGGATGLIGTAAVTVDNGATLRFNRTGSYTAVNDIDGEGELEIQGGGSATFSGNLTHEGTTAITGNSTLRVDGSFNGGNGISVEAGSTFGGLGSVQLGGGEIVLADGAFLAPGGESTLGVMNLDNSVLDLIDIRG